MMVRNLPAHRPGAEPTPEEYARFLELSAQQQIDMQERVRGAPRSIGCRGQDLHRNPARTNQEINNLLGAERRQKLETYRNTMGEREPCPTAQSSADATSCSDDKAESLIQALAEERNAIREAVKQGGGTRASASARA